MSSFGYTVLGFGAHPNRTTTTPSPYVSFAAINSLSLDSDFATLETSSSTFSNSCFMAVGPTELITGLAGTVNLGGSNYNLVQHNYDTSTTLSTSIQGPLGGADYAEDASGNPQTSIRGGCYSYNGDYLYIAGQGGSNRVIRFDLAIPYQLGSVSSQANTVTLGSAMDALQGIAILGDGTKFYAMRSTSGAVGQVIEYALSTPYDLTTRSVTRTVNAAYTGNFSGGFCMDIAIAPDGSSFIIGSVGGSGAAGYQTILDQWPITNGDISPISGSTGRISVNFSKNLSNTYDSVGDDADTYSQAFNFNPTGDALLLSGVHEDDGPSGTSNQWHVTRWS